MKVEDKRAAVMQAMMELVMENGFHGTAMSMVARRAGVAAGTIYHYFESKEEVINQLYAELKQRMSDVLIEESMGKGTIKDRFFGFYYNLYRYFISHPAEFYFLEQYINSPFISQFVQEPNQRFSEPVVQFLQQGMELGVMRPLDLRMLVALVYGHVVSLAKLQLSAEMEIDQAMLEQAAQSCWDGVRIN